MRSLPSFVLVAGILGGLLTSALALPGPVNRLLASVAPRGAAEDAIAQALVLPVAVAASNGFTGYGDENCPQPEVVYWQWLIRHPGGWASFEWLLHYAATDAGRFLALAGLATTEPERFAGNEGALVQAAALPRHLRILPGYNEAGRARTGEMTRLAPSDSLLSLVRSGAFAADYLAVVNQKGCFR